MVYLNCYLDLSSGHFPRCFPACAVLVFTILAIHLANGILDFIVIIMTNNMKSFAQTIVFINV